MCWAWISTPITSPPVSPTPRGNPVAEPVTIDVQTSGFGGLRRDGQVHAAITDLLNLTEHHQCAAIVVENPDFAAARATGRETTGRGAREKRLRRTVAGIPTRRFRDRLTSIAARRGIGVIGVDPAHTSMWGRQHWRKPLQQQTSDPATVTVPSRCGGRDRQTWTRQADQTPAGRAPHPTADACGHSTGQTRPAAGHHTTVPQFWLTATPTTTTRRAGPPENTHHQRPTPLGPHTTHSRSLIKNGSGCRIAYRVAR